MCTKLIWIFTLNIDYRAFRFIVDKRNICCCCFLYFFWLTWQTILLENMYKMILLVVSFAGILCVWMIKKEKRQIFYIPYTILYFFVFSSVVCYIMSLYVGVLLSILFIIRLKSFSYNNFFFVPNKFQFK